MAQGIDFILQQSLKNSSALKDQLELKFTWEDPFDTQFGKVLEKLPDLVHYLRLSNGQGALLHVEFQRRQEGQFSLRMLLYYVLLRERNAYGCEVYQVALNTG